MNPYDPYAPPREMPVPPQARAPLPEGIRRFALARDEFEALVHKALLRRLAWMLPFLAAYVALVAWSAGMTLDTLVVSVPVWGATLVAMVFFTRARLRRAIPPALAGYELLVSPRAMRRTARGVPPAEILAPEVTSLVEVPEGLSIAAGEQRLFVSRAVDGYAQVRDHVRAWRDVETAAGFAAWRRKLRHTRRERVCDPAHNPSLARDASMAGELDAVRALAMPPDPASVRANRWRRVVVWWLVLVVAFLVIWQLLTPAPRRRERRAPRIEEPSEPI